MMCGTRYYAMKSIDKKKECSRIPSRATAKQEPPALAIWKTFARFIASSSGLAPIPNASASEPTANAP